VPVVDPGMADSRPSRQATSRVSARGRWHRCHRLAAFGARYGGFNRRRIDRAAVPISAPCAACLAAACLPVSVVAVLWVSWAARALGRGAAAARRVRPQDLRDWPTGRAWRPPPGRRAADWRPASGPRRPLHPPGGRRGSAAPLPGGLLHGLQNCRRPPHSPWIASLSRTGNRVSGCRLRNPLCAASRRRSSVYRAVDGRLAGQTGSGLASRRGTSQNMAFCIEALYHRHAEPERPPRLLHRVSERGVSS